MAGKYDFNIDQGSTFTRDFVYKDTDGSPQDLTGYTARMMIRKSHNAADPPTLDTSDHAGSLVISDAAGGKVTLSLTDEITQALPAPFEGVYDIEIESSGGVVTRLIEGRVIVSPNVTK